MTNDQRRPKVDYQSWQNMRSANGMAKGDFSFVFTGKIRGLLEDVKEPKPKKK